METQKSSSSSSLDAWLAESVRVTAFPAAPTGPLGADKLWGEVIGGEPETSVTKHKEGIQEVQGPFKAGKAALTLHPTRIQWTLLAGPTEEEEPQAVATIGPFCDAATDVVQLAKKWLCLNSCSPMTRIALGAVLLQPTPDRVAGYKKMSGYLEDSVKLDPEGSRDFMYRINRRRDTTCGVANLSINRLATWSVALFASIVGTVSPTGGTKPFVAKQVYALRLELDVNTAPEYQDDLPPDKLSALLDEFYSLATEIATQGDIP
jgi:hypothetical protein